MSGRPPALAAVVFDFDGVILESAEIKTEAFLELFAAHPEHREAILRHHYEHLGISRFDKFAWIYRHLLGRELDAAESRRLGEAYSALVLERVLACPPVPGALELLSDLRGRLRAFVASGTPQGELERIVELRGLAPYFDEVRGAPDTKEVIVRDLLRRYRLGPATVLMVGDGLSDYRAALAAGVRFVARESDHQDFGGADVVRVADLTELRPLVGLAPASRVRGV